MTDAPLRGSVTAFDEHVGLGTVTSEDGTEYLFHCVEIAGGGRTIGVGAAVTFDRLAKLGRYEASAVTPV